MRILLVQESDWLARGPHQQRPGILKIPGLDYLSLVFSHRIEIGRQIEEFRPDIIIGFGILNAYLAMNLAKKKKIPFVYYLIDALHTLIPSKLLWPLGKIVEKQGLKRADRVIVINEKLMDYAIGMEAPSERTSVVGAGVDLDRFNSNIKGRKIRRLKLDFGIPCCKCFKHYFC